MALVHRGPRKATDETPTEEQGEVKCTTPWKNLEQGDIVIVKLTCQAYQPMHPVDMSCHTTLPLTVESFKSHMAPDHGAGGGFGIQLRHRPGVKTSIWADLTAEGIECHDFRCDVCGEELPLAPRRIIKHIAAHPGKSRAPRAGGLFWITLKTTTPEEGEDEFAGYGDEA